MSQFKPRTYLLTGSLIYRIDEKCRHFGINPSDLVRFLLDYGLTKLEHGELKINTKITGRVIDSYIDKMN